MKEKNILNAHIIIQHIGAILNAGVHISEDEKNFLLKVMPLRQWKNAYQPLNCMPLIFGKAKDGNRYLNIEFLKYQDNFRKLLFVWAKLVIKNPVVIIRYYLKSTELLWRINVPYRTFVIADEDLMEEHLYTGYKPSKRLIERTGNMGRHLITFINNQNLGWFLHRGALYFWISVFFLTLTILRHKQFIILVIATPMILQAASVATFPLVQNTRFMFPIILTTPLFVSLFFASKLNRQHLLTNS